jgi:HB1, ASXL, restriction endonuclease HTH domain
MAKDDTYQLYTQILSIKRKELASLQDEVAMLEKQVGDMDGSTTTPDGRKRTALYMAEVVLRKAGKPMHTREIAKAIQDEFGTFMRIDTLGTRLHRAAVERKKTFLKVEDAPNTYSLLK